MRGAGLFAKYFPCTRPCAKSSSCFISFKLTQLLDGKVLISSAGVRRGTHFLQIPHHVRKDARIFSLLREDFLHITAGFQAFTVKHLAEPGGGKSNLVPIPPWGPWRVLSPWLDLCWDLLKAQSSCFSFPPLQPWLLGVISSLWTSWSLQEKQRSCGQLGFC